MTDDRALPPGWAYVHFDEIDSTNAEALRRAAAGVHGPLWLTADRQTSGRGRSGRPWLSAPGSVAATLLFSPGCTLGALPQVSLVAGVAAHDAIASLLPQAIQPRCRLKWPNDVMIDGAKVSGILVESTTRGSEPVVAIGIGINAGAAPALADRLATGLAEHGPAAASAAMGAVLAAALARWLDIWLDPVAGFPAIRSAWLARGYPPGEAMTVHADGVKVAGAFAGLEPDGSLLLRIEGNEIRSFSFGDVALGASRV
jgi:BirA family biotin operon repressor/biotin-[acetyl-CoA-carboxylase] ligase